MRTALTLCLTLVPTLALADAIVWPDLPKTCFVSGRPATSQDIDTGCAAFLINVQGKPAGKPINVDVPQYALHVDEATGKETPVIIIQAEGNGATEVVGYQELGSDQLGAALLREVRLLGTQKPI